MAQESRVEADLFDVVVYLVNSAPTSLGETPSLAAFRMVDAADRLLRILEQTSDDPQELAFVSAARADFDEHHHLVMTDQEAFQRWLPDLVRRVTEEAMRRAQVPTP